MTVASAAPLIPRPSANINIGSRIIFKTEPISMDAIANLGLPSALIMELIVAQTAKKGNPTATIYP